ncbi:MAG: GtrA family protein [Clostridia bacterium]|nr:GtrA family protein [Clostridia bacterium]
MNKNLLQAIKFTLFSISAGIVQTLSFALLHDVLGWTSYWTSYVPSLVLSVLWNFTFNRKYTFKSDRPIGRQMLLVAMYYVVFTPASAWWGTLLEKAGMHDWLIQVINMLINFVTEFLYQKFVVFHDDKDAKTQEKA